MVSIPEREPDAIVQGMTLRFRKSFSDYNPDDGWLLNYTWMSKDGPFTAAGVDQGDGSWLVELTALETADIVPGEYEWAAVVSGGPSGTDRKQVGVGTTRVELDISSSPAGVDRRSYAARLLEAVEDTLFGRATSDQASYSIGGVSIAKIPPNDLHVWRSRLRAEVFREKRAERLSRGLGHPSNVNVRL